ncbi:MAG: hypothetical protein UX80_C0008G0004 [Candidatus Amesbacteria bacterium GW2011_GWA2_47_11b]|uniref:DUF559 domain-containing protein n=3 Tax=Candidatus Amesiibacteriota TaxID=1752730 RepID=A0A0G1SKP5_9BACT|nr:MAG: hypothetical protein UX42_C0002G0004 [Microgenomates group bacterium GW2011_GWC1_46_20]KKU57891.1 MAG: hypothetical protein UX80_C0008G0004 [Candidatus Amesbacteria bacterium GW2011_GWA2_47_11b]KKU70069.1 MAG: hypothetical protein UX92_C0005G0040 [Candidatus Amesbacteria bacterium GW2011_GWA1_47_20]KKU83919.1 MAG: hypothetical protein UY11_C0010G0004 [Candidatus Amesbacteria bacterium GW2011_GWC2_47_8]
MKNRRKELRNSATFEEKLLWKYLQNKKLGFKFIRQYSIEGYVVDFYCPAKRLAIELDGNVHFNASQQKYDKYRTRYLEAFNITVVRFHNLGITKNIGKILERITFSLLD